MKRSIFNTVILLLSCALFLTAAPVRADYPDKNINVIVPFPAGGAIDIQARVFDKAIKKYVGHNFIINSKPGAGGAIGTTAIARSKPDGYTIGIATYPHILIQPSKKIGNYKYDDLEYLGAYVFEPQILLAAKDSPFKSYKDFKKACQEKPGQIKVGVSAPLSEVWYAANILKKLEGLDFNIVAFNGSPQMVMAMTAKQVDAAIGNPATMYPELHQFPILGVFAEERLKTIPDAPTFKEMGHDGINAQYFRTWVAPKGVSPDKLNKLKTALKSAFDDPEIQQRFKEMHLNAQWLEGDKVHELLKTQEKEIMDNIAAFKD